MFKFIWIFILIIAVGGLSYFGYPIVKDRYFSDNRGIQETNTDSDKNIPTSQTQSKNITEDNDSEPNPVPMTPSEETSKSEPENKNPEINVITPEQSYEKITVKDCNSECEKFKNNENKLAYCRQICGLGIKSESDDCQNLKNLERDYCFKDMAIAKNDFKICDEIKDSGIKKTCQNRLTEEMLN